MGVYKKILGIGRRIFRHAVEQQQNKGEDRVHAALNQLDSIIVELDKGAQEMNQEYSNAQHAIATLTERSEVLLSAVGESIEARGKLKEILGA